MAKVLSEKDKKKREMILNGPILPVIFRIGAPLALFQGLNLFFKLYDSMLASTISPMSVSVVAYLSQLSAMITALGGGFAVGSSIKISEAYGAGKYDLVHKRVQLLFGFSTLISCVILGLIPFTAQFLRVTGTPEEFISSGTVYFALHLVDNVLLLFNTAYIAIERARGNSGRILTFNMISIVVKIALNTLFIVVMDFGIEMMAVATILSDCVIFAGFIYHLCIKGKGEVFSFSFKEIRYEQEVANPMLKTSVPVVVEKTAFQLGKVTINSMCNLYGTLVVGALGVSNNISSMTMAPINGFQEASISVISQNNGAGNRRRALSAFYTLLMMNVVAGFCGWSLSMHFLPQISSLFDGGDPEFTALIHATYYYEGMALIPLAINSAVMALLYGNGYTKLTLLINFSRVFVFRVPVLWYLQQFTDIGSDAVGIVMMVSNLSTGIFALIVAFIVVQKVKKEIALEELELKESESTTIPKAEVGEEVENQEIKEIKEIKECTTLETDFKEQEETTETK